MIPDSLRPFLSRVIAGLVAAGAAYVETKFQVVINPDTKAALVGGAMAAYGVVYPIVHRSLDKSWNPGDAASTHQAVAEKAEVTAIKQEEKAVKDARTNYPE